MGNPMASDGRDDVERKRETKKKFAKERGGVRDGACSDWSTLLGVKSRRILANAQISCGLKWVLH